MDSSSGGRFIGYIKLDPRQREGFGQSSKIKTWRGEHDIRRDK
jgi:hypothetical protein